jgi:hypothetical protein
VSVAWSRVIRAAGEQELARRRAGSRVPHLLRDLDVDWDPAARVDLYPNGCASLLKILYYCRIFMSQ